jgi:hypothetical protein
MSAEPIWAEYPDDPEVAQPRYDADHDANDVPALLLAWCFMSVPQSGKGASWPTL